jgi:homoserine dehydrogenase
VVLKFGSSVLRTPDDLPRLVSEVYARWRHAHPIVVVVSAFRGRTDELLELAARVGDRGRSLPALVGLGEQEAAAALALALERAGLPVRLIDPSRVGIIAVGASLEADPVAVDPWHVLAPLEAGEIAVVPGFVARDPHGEPVLLGRGGSDLTAVRLAHTLGGEAVLLKGSGRVYEWDPAEAGPAPRAFRTLSYADALALGDRVLQPRALRHARELGIAVRVVGLGEDPLGDAGTLVNGAPTTFDHHDAPGPAGARPLRIALLGLGAVGLGVARRLAGDADRFEVVGALVRDAGRPREGLPTGIRLHDDPEPLLDASPDVVVELLGGTDPARGLIERALRQGSAVVTANKALLAMHADRLETLAREHGTHVLHSGAAGGALPVLELARVARRAGRVVRVRGILNGTTNFILDELLPGGAFEEVLRDARRRGYAEEDPSADITSLDAACKIVLIARELGGPVPTLGSIQRDRLTASTRVRYPNAVVRQVAELVLADGEARASVLLRPLPDSDPLSRIRGVRNAIEFTLADGRKLTATAAGAGRWPTTEAVYADLLDVLRHRTLSDRHGLSIDLAADRPPVRHDAH